MRLTLDRGAMEVLLEQMSEEARVDFSNKVLRHTLNKIASDITQEQFYKAINKLKTQELDEIVSSARSWEPKLNDSEKWKIRKAIDHEIDSLKGDFKGQLSMVTAKETREAKQRIQDRIRAYTEGTIKQAIRDMVTEAISEQLGSLIELGGALQSMQTVKAESDGISKAD